MKKEKNKKGAAGIFLKNVSYGTGILFRKVKQIGKVAETKPWKGMVSMTHELCETVGEKAEVVLKKVTKTIEKNTEEMGESFKAGMEAVPTVDAKSKTRKKIQEKKGISSPALPAAPAKKKAQGVIKGKVKAAAKKVKSKISVEKKAPANAVLENEIEKITEDVKDI